MAKCKLCRTDIPDGTEYCQVCQNKRNDDKANESYLDSLLNSVKNTSEPSEITIRKKNKKDSIYSPAEKVRKASESKKTSKAPITQKSMKSENSGLEDDDLYRVDFSDLEDFNKFNFEADLQDIDNDIIISEEDLFGDDVSKLLIDRGEEVVSYDYRAELEQVVNDTIADHRVVQHINQGEPDRLSEEVAENNPAETAMKPIPHYEAQAENNTQTEYKVESKHETESEYEEKAVDEVEAESAADLEEERAEALAEPEEAVIKAVNDNIIPQELENLPEDSGLDLDLDELLNSLDIPETAAANEEQEDIPTEASKVQKDESASAENSLEDMFHAFSGEDAIEDLNLDAGTPSFEPVEAEDEDFMKLLSQISGDDPVSGDLKAINEMMSNHQSEIKPMSMPGDVGEVFSDALTAVSSLKDFDQDVEDMFNPSPDLNGKASKDDKGKKDKKKKAAKKPEKEGKDKKVKPEGNLLQRLFGNVKNEKTAALYAEESKQKEAEKFGASGEKLKKAKGKKKDKKGAESPDEEELTGSDRKPRRDSEEEAAPINKKAEKKKAKAEKKKAKEVIEVIDEIEEDPGRINRLGAAIVFLFFGALAAILILGTSIISYTLNIQHASDYFLKQKYTEAYYEVYGVELKDEDLELYEKIATVMFVNKQLNSYNNYYNIKQYPQALDSLLKGLKRYDKYIELATYLGVDSDLNYVRDQILAELNRKYNLTESEAVQINSIANMKDYSLAVYDVVLEKMNK